MLLTLVVNQPLTAPSQTPVPQDQLEIDPNRTSVTFNSVLPGGFGSCNIGIPDQGRMARTGVMPTGLALDDDAHLQLWAGSRLAWEGQVVAPSLGPGGLHDGVMAEGYGISGVSDGPFLSTSTAMMTSGQLLLSFLGSSGSPLSAYLDIDMATFTDPGVLHALSEFDGAVLGDILGQISKEGDGSGTIYDWAVWEGARLALQPRTAPAAPDYVVPFDAGLVKWTRNRRKRYSSIYVRYTDLTTNAQMTLGPITNPAFVGRARTAYINGGTMSLGGVTAFANQFLLIHANVEDAISITRVAPDGIGGPGLGERPLWLARAGQWVQIADQAPQIITRAEYNSANRTLDLKLGGYYADAVDLWADHISLAHAVKRNRNPLTGARAL